jgi:hypothetical protein
VTMEEKHAIRVLFFHHGESARDHGRQPWQSAAVQAGRGARIAQIDSFAASEHSANRQLTS